MNEQHQAVEASWLLFYLIGYIGVLYHVFKYALQIGRTLDVLVAYMKQNSLAILASIVAYNAVVMLWKWSDSLAFLGMMKGELNAMTIPLGYMADSVFKDSLGMISKKLKERGNQEEKPE
jgi:hypothetical protein